ncbi:MAG: EAL domain-containing protein [Burkholderiaceae bacterium]|jgi:diguanylate cyclase (GGDEF)-like protein/PAS domain S-box-containing protein|nr:EAL domain-containing protein [Aquabacterium sp.]NUP86311.1 EAL domain-containing protein [Burkholderiaceae bacterium]
MPKRYEPPDWDALQRRVVGLGEHSHRKSHFAVLQERLEELERSRAVLRAERDLSQLYLDTVPAFVVVLDLAGRITMINSFGCRLLGHEPGELIGQDWFATCVTPGSPRLTAQSHIDALLRSGALAPGYFEGELVSRDGRPILVAWRNVLLRESSGRIVGTLCAGEDITTRRAAEQALHNLAFFDPLTSLPNRRLLNDRLRQCMTASERSGFHGALIFLDLDQFKLLNDTRGHAVGDLLLQRAGSRLQEAVRACDTVARMGGDEFVVLLQNLNTRPADAGRQAAGVAAKLVQTLSGPYDLPGAAYQGTVSAGVVLFRGSDSTVDELLQHADVAMYQAKASGRNATRFYDPAMQDAIDARTALADALRSALQAQAIVLHYQPQFDPHGKCTGLEALARWPRTASTWVAPSQFIPVAEEAGLIEQLGEHVLSIACRQLAAWSNATRLAELPISVNVSAVQLRSPGFVAAVGRCLRESGVAPQRLKLEITESVLVHNPDEVIAKLSALRRSGVTFALDDFGTGYSSLAYLKRLPINQVKIDRSFVHDLPVDPNSAAICNAIVGLGNSLGLQVVAEGVETKAQWDHLRVAGCGMAQGYYFCRPLPPEHIPAQLGADASGTQ